MVLIISDIQKQNFVFLNMLYTCMNILFKYRPLKKKPYNIHIDFDWEKYML